MPLLVLFVVVAFAPGLVFFLMHLADALLSNAVVDWTILTGLALTVLLSAWRERRCRRP